MNIFGAHTRPAHPDWHAARIVHLTGGCRAINGLDPLLEFEPALTTGQRIRMNLRAYTSLYDDLKAVDIAAIGIDFVYHPNEMRSPLPSNWRTFQPWADTVWPCQDQIDFWAQIGHAGFKAKDTRLWDIARRISHQIRTCSWRLRQISECYQDQLHSRKTGGKFKVGTRFEDGFTWLGYLSIQSFLVDACVLRDYLAEFCAMFALPEPELTKNLNITSMSGLIKILKKLVASNDVTKELNAATTNGGWLYVLGAYRDLVVHCVPLAKADSSLLARSTELIVRGAGALPAISLPLPDDPSGIKDARAKGKHHSAPMEELTFFVKANRGHAPTTDGLIYAYRSLDQLTRLAKLLGKHAPLPPEIPTITDADVIGRIEKITK